MSSCLSECIHTISPIPQSPPPPLQVGEEVPAGSLPGESCWVEGGGTREKGHHRPHPCHCLLSNHTLSLGQRTASDSPSPSGPNSHTFSSPLVTSHTPSHYRWPRPLSSHTLSPPTPYYSQQLSTPVSQQWSQPFLVPPIHRGCH